MDVLQACKILRTKNSQSLNEILESILKTEKPISEKTVVDLWLHKLRTDVSLFNEGWYMPPPHGIAVLFASPENVERVSYKSLRVKEFWPQNNILLNKTKDLVVLYSSPVDKKTGVIGDFGLTLYLGNNQKIKDHFKKSYEVYLKIFDNLKIGMNFSQIYKKAKKIMNKQGLYSDLLSPSDPAGTNIGHTIVNLTQEELKKIREKTLSWIEAKDILSKKRIFISGVEEQIIKPGMAFTIEPRPQDQMDKKLPMALFHSIVIFDNNGNKEVLTGFDRIFKASGMDYLLK